MLVAITEIVYQHSVPAATTTSNDESSPAPPSTHNEVSTPAAATSEGRPLSDSPPTSEEDSKPPADDSVTSNLANARKRFGEDEKDDIIKKFTKLNESTNTKDLTYQEKCDMLGVNPTTLDRWRKFCRCCYAQFSSVRGNLVRCQKCDTFMCFQCLANQCLNEMSKLKSDQEKFTKFPCIYCTTGTLFDGVNGIPKTIIPEKFHDALIIQVKKRLSSLSSECGLAFTRLLATKYRIEEFRWRSDPPLPYHPSPADFQVSLFKLTNEVYNHCRKSCGNGFYISELATTQRLMDSLKRWYPIHYPSREDPPGHKSKSLYDDIRLSFEALQSYERESTRMAYAFFQKLRHTQYADEIQPAYARLRDIHNSYAMYGRSSQSSRRSLDQPVDLT